MPDNLLIESAGLTSSDLSLATAIPSDVAEGKTFYAGSKDLKTGTARIASQSVSFYGNYMTGVSASLNYTWTITESQGFSAFVLHLYGTGSNEIANAMITPTNCTKIGETTISYSVPGTQLGSQYEGRFISFRVNAYPCSVRAVTPSWNWRFGGQIIGFK